MSFVIIKNCSTPLWGTTASGGTRPPNLGDLFKNYSTPLLGTTVLAGTRPLHSDNIEEAVCTCTYACMYVCIYVCMHARVHSDTHRYTLSLICTHSSPQKPRFSHNTV